MNKCVSHATRSLRPVILGALVLTFLLSGFGLTPPTVDAQGRGRRYSLTIHNQSRYTIYHLYVSSSDEANWGPDQLGDGTLGSDRSFTLTQIRPGEYDIKVVDEDGDECVLQAIPIFSNRTWTISTRSLLRCQGFGG